MLAIDINTAISIPVKHGRKGVFWYQFSLPRTPERQVTDAIIVFSPFSAELCAFIPQWYLGKDPQTYRVEVA
jgi:hypothetical protein